MLLFLILYLNGFKWTLTYLMNRDLSEVVKKSTCCCYRADCLWKVSIIFSHLNCGYKDSELYFSLPSPCAQPSKLGGLVMLRVLNFVDCMGEPKLLFLTTNFSTFSSGGGERAKLLWDSRVEECDSKCGESSFWRIRFLTFILFSVVLAGRLSDLHDCYIPTHYLLVGIRILT